MTRSLLQWQMIIISDIILSLTYCDARMFAGQTGSISVVRKKEGEEIPTQPIH
jgi:hypothetical protein